MNFPPTNNYFIFVVISVLCLLFSFRINAATFVSDGMALKVEKVSSGLGIPWGMTFLSETVLLVTERSGSVLLLLKIVSFCFSDFLFLAR